MARDFLVETADVVGPADAANGAIDAGGEGHDRIGRLPAEEIEG